MALTRAQIQTAFQNSLGRAASTSDENSYFSVSQSGALSDSQIFTSISNSREADIVADPVIRFYQAAFGRVPDQQGLVNFENFIRQNGSTLATYTAVANTFVASQEFTNRFGTGTAVDAAYVQALYSTILGRSATNAEVDGYVSGAAGYTTRGGVLYAISQSNEANAISNDAVNGFQLNAAQGTAVYQGTLYTAQNGSPNGPSNGQSFTLTTGVDNLTGTSAGDTFNAGDVNGAAVFTTGDQINGAGGTDTLNITQNAAFTALPTGVSVTNVETVNLTTGGAATINTTTGFTGLTSLNTNSVGGATVTAAGTTAITARDAGTTGGSEAITVNGGSTVNVIATNNVADVITVGGTTAATGAVTVSSTGGTTNTNTSGAINVTGGTTVAVTQLAGNVAAVGNDTVGGIVTVNGSALTTSVAVGQTATQTGSATAIGFTAGQVVIADLNAANATADTIAAVSLTGYGTASTINSGALNTLNLSSAGAGLTVNGNVTAANQTATTLGVNVSGFTNTGTVTLNNYTTLNIAATTAASTFGALTDAAATTLNVSGDATVNLGTVTAGAITAVNSTNTGGLTIGNALGTGVAYNLGAGADSIVLSSGFTKAITLGAGNDKVTYSGAAGTGGSVVAGDGIDTISTTGALAAAASLTPDFNSTFSGFEVLGLTTDAGANVIDLAGINGVNQVTAIGQTNATINGFTSGGSLTLTGASTSETIGVTNAALNLTDSFNIGLNNSTGATVAFGAVNVANIENINITLTDSGTAANTAATVDTLTLADIAVKSIVVSGNNGLTLTNTGNVNVTSFNASGVVGNDVLDTADNLAVTFTSLNTTANSAVTIVGGAGNDVLTGSTGTNAHTITGGNGADTITGSQGNDTIILTETVAARDIVVLRAAATNGVDTITSFATGTATTADTIQLVNAATTANTASAAANLGESTNTTLTTGAQTFALTGANTTTNDVIEINATLSTFGNLGAAGVVDGTELLKALSSNNVATASITANTASDDFYLVAYQNNNAYVYQVINNDTSVVASEINLVGVTTGVAQGAFVANNFTVGA